MVEITSVQPSERIATKAKRAWIRKLSPSAFVVTPKDRKGTKRKVTLSIEGDRLLARCEHFRTGEECPANAFGVLCYSVMKTVAHLEHQAVRKSGGMRKKILAFPPIEKARRNAVAGS